MIVLTLAIPMPKSGFLWWRINHRAVGHPHDTHPSHTSTLRSPRPATGGGCSAGRLARRADPQS